MVTDKIDQDKMPLVDEAELGDEGSEDSAENDELEDDVAAQWAAMIGETATEDPNNLNGAERLLNQGEIDNLLGFNLDDQDFGEATGIQALINSALVSYERLPMLEIVSDRLVRLMTTSLRNFTSDNVEVSLDNISTIRFGDYLNSIPLPAMISVFKAVEWDNFGLMTVGSNLIYSIVDVLLGGRGAAAKRTEGRPYTTIESNLVKRMMEVILDDMVTAFSPLSPVKFELERLETNPRFAAISRPANAAILIRLRIDMEDRGGKIEVLLPYSTLEPIRELLLQGFMGEKFGRDNIWESHLSTEIWSTKIDIDVVLDELKLPLNRLMNLKVGETVMLHCGPQDKVTLRSGGIPLVKGAMGRSGDQVAIQVTGGLKKPQASEVEKEPIIDPVQ